MIDIDTLVEIWEAESRARHTDSDRGNELEWWRSACQYLRPTPEDDAILDDEENRL